jgi:hypothetical protein
MEFVVRPPNALRPGCRMRVPIIVGVRVEGDLNRNEELVLFLSLRDASGQKPAAGLSGETSDNVHSRDYSVTRGHSKFEGLSIAAPGEYRIRVYLSVTTEGGTVAKHYIDSSVIRVHSGAGLGQGACMFLCVR